MTDEHLIDPTKPVQTRDGRKAKILATDVMKRFPGSDNRHDGQTIAAVIGDEQIIRYFFPDGQYLHERVDPYDLINVPESAPSEEPRDNLAEAAAEMLAVLKDVAKYHWDHLSPGFSDRINAVIAKAEGRSDG